MREPVWVIFGEALVAPTSVESAGWIAGSLRGRPGTVGALVSDRFASVLRLSPPAPVPDVWWEHYRSLFDVVASIGSRYTSTPTRAWFATWEGHGFVPSVTRIG